MNMPAETSRFDDEGTARSLREIYGHLLALDAPEVVVLVDHYRDFENSRRAAASRLRDLVEMKYGKASRRREIMPEVTSVLDDVEHDWVHRFGPEALEVVVDLLFAVAFREMVNENAPAVVNTLLGPARSSGLGIPL